jgi:hypothetical protein
MIVPSRVSGTSRTLYWYINVGYIFDLKETINTNVKNLLVLKHYKLKNLTGWDPSKEHEWTQGVWDDMREHVKKYDLMKEMCIASAKDSILGLDDIIVHESQVDDIQHAFKQHFYDLYDIWRQGNTNILYADLDVLFIRKFNWFDFSSKFVMYNAGNCGIRYHGHDMDEVLWTEALKRCEVWKDNKRWDYEQDIYVNMLRHPLNWDFYQRQANEYYQRVINRPEFTSPEEFYEQNKKCCAVHFHGSRGDSQISKMKDLFSFLNFR